MTYDKSIVGINSNSLSELSSNIATYAEQNNIILNQFIELLDSTKEFYACSDGDEFRKRFEKIHDNKVLFNDYILSYCNEISFIINSFQSLDDELTANINNNS